MIDETVRDATFRQREERTALKAQLARAQRWELVGQLAAGIAHEINTPTQYIGDNLRFLRDAFADLRPLLTSCLALLDTRGGLTAQSDRRTPPDAAAGKIRVPRTVENMLAPRTEEKMPAPPSVEMTDAEFLLGEIPAAIEQSLEGVERVAEIARSMKDFSHPDNGQKHPVDLNRVIQSTLIISRNEWKYVAEVTTDLDPGLPPVECVPGEINQVLLNLIVNAAHAVEAKRGPGAAGCGAPSAEDGRQDACPKAGTIAIRTRQDGDWVQIQVEDSGSGIPEPIRDKVFERFFTTKEAGRGTGQGLAIARGIVVDRHGGTISFDTQVGRGTVFTVRIPINPGVGKGDKSHLPERPATNLRSLPGFAQIGPVPISPSVVPFDKGDYR
jgi:signal transduction histidine kinase